MPQPTAPEQTQGLAVQHAPAVAAPSELTQAFAHADDRSERLDYQLGNLEETLTRLTIALEPVMSSGHPFPDTPGATPPGTVPEDSRSQVTRKVHSLAVRYDRAADYVSDQAGRVQRLIEALEV